MSKELAQHIRDEIRGYCYLSSAVKETTYCWLFEKRKDLISAANQIVDILEEEIQRRGEELEGIMAQAGLTIDDLCDEEDLDIIS